MGIYVILGLEDGDSCSRCMYLINVEKVAMRLKICDYMMI